MTHDLDHSLESPPSFPRRIVLWLFSCCALVFLMVIVGAITRLSGSGLSMVEWKPLIGALPPLNEQEWQRVFALYQGSPEFEKKNFWMELGDFKQIFFWEWFHRLLGRLIGVVYLLPFLFFAFKKWIPKGYGLPLFFAFILGGAQGFMGWYMVKSGLVDVPAVSHYRLAAHLSLALIIYGYMFWLGLSLWRERNDGSPSPTTSRAALIYGWLCFGALSITIIWGAFTAGLDAGLVYNDSFPKMGGRWIPEELWFSGSPWHNIFENHASVQFVHRWLAMGSAALIFGFAFRVRRQGLHVWVLAALVLGQVILGIVTLLSGVELTVAVMHQGNAVLVLSALLFTLYKLTDHSSSGVLGTSTP